MLAAWAFADGAKVLFFGDIFSAETFASMISLGISLINLDIALNCTSPRVILCFADVIVRLFFALVIAT